jgi:hypothetical protein
MTSLHLDTPANTKPMNSYPESTTGLECTVQWNDGPATAIPADESPRPAKPDKEYYAHFQFLNDPGKTSPWISSHTWNPARGMMLSSW